MKLYTRTGDAGTTALFGGSRVPKHHLRLDAYGTLDELNSFVGLLRQDSHPDAVPVPLWERIQSDLFILGAHLATPPEQVSRLSSMLSHPLLPAEALEADIDRLTSLAPALTAFVLPAGTRGAAQAHVTRTVCRRAERLVAAVAETAPVPDEVLIYLNRLSDWLFALARAENALAGQPDVPWNPGG